MDHRRGVSRGSSWLDTPRQWLRVSGLTTLGLIAALGLGAGPVNAGWGDYEKYKGAETLDLVSVGVNEARCGAPPNFEAVFEGEGIDTAGGVFTVVSSGCQNIATGEVFDLTAVDTYANGDSVTIEAEDFTLVFDPQTCASSNVWPVFYDIAGGTGAFAGAQGYGTFDFASNDPACNGEIAPAFVWFKGKIK